MSIRAKRRVGGRRRELRLRARGMTEQGLGRPQERGQGGWETGCFEGLHGEPPQHWWPGFRPLRCANNGVGDMPPLWPGEDTEWSWGCTYRLVLGVVGTLEVAGRGRDNGRPRSSPNSCWNEGNWERESWMTGKGEQRQ